MNLLNLALTGAVPVTAAPASILSGQPRALAIQANFAYGSGGTSVDAFVQTSLDSGKTWTDIAEFHFTTSSARKAVNLSSQTPVTAQVALTDGAMTANTAQDGLLGPQFRVKYTSTGTYAATSLAIDIQANLLPAFP